MGDFADEMADFYAERDMTPTDTGVSEELARLAETAYWSPYGDWKAVVEAIAPRLKAEGLKAFARKHNNTPDGSDWTDGWNSACETMISEADALSPEAKETE